MKPRHFQKSQSGILSTFLLLVLSSAWAQNPVPSISTPLFPQSLAPGGPSFVLTVDGSEFVASSVVEWNGAALPTTFVSGGQLKANVPSANIASPGTAWITVSNGGVASNVGYFEITNATTTVSFSQNRFFPGNLPTNVVAGDFNGDGRLDLAVANSYGKVSILLGNGEGTFQPAVTYAVAVSLGFTFVAAGDFNGDGNLDLAVTGLGTTNGTVTILLGNGDGTFTPASGSPLTVGIAPNSVAVGDFNGDGKLDLAVPNAGDNTVSILLGNGNGSFTAASGSPFQVGPEPFSVGLGDFNGDGNVDLAVLSFGATNGTVGILLGNGDGTFTPFSGGPLTVGNSPTSVTVGDFNGDGKLDLAVPSRGSNTVSVLLGNGYGSFTAAPGSPVPVSASTVAVAVGDVNGDGNLDLAVATGYGESVSVLLGKGDGTFSAASDFGVDNFPDFVAMADFNGDGRMDLAVVNGASNSVSILLQPTPAPPQGSSDTTEILSLAAGTGLLSTGGQSPTLSLNTSFTDGRYLQLTGGTLTGGLFAPTFYGSGANLTNLNPANLLSGTAGINITGNAATATVAAAATNSLALGGVGPGGYAPSAGSSSYIQNNSASAQTANLNISGNAGIGGNASVTGNLATTGPLTIGGTGTPIKGHTSIQVNPSFPALKGGACASANFALGGAADGDTIALGVPSERMSANATVIYTAWVSAANTVTVQACDILGTQKTAGTGSIRIDLWKH